MDYRPTSLKPAEQLVQKSKASEPNESAAYRKARTALLVEEIELRRHVATEPCSD